MTGVHESVLAAFTTDKATETKGKWVEIGPAKFLLARAGGSNTKFQKAIEAVMRPYQRMIAMDQFSEAEAAKLSVKPFVDTVLLGWENVRPVTQDEDGEWQVGEPIPFSKEKAVEILTNLPDLFRRLLTESTNIGNFAPDFVKVASGN